MLYVQSLQYWSDLVTMQRFVMKVLSVNQILGVVLREPHLDDLYSTLNIKLVEVGMATCTGKW